MKKIFICIFFALFIFLLNTAAATESQTKPTCEYQSEFDECLEANKNGNPRGITDFICINSTSPEAIIYQIVFDKESKKIDEEVKKYLTNLEKNKSFYFGKDSKESFLKGIDDLEKMFGNGEGSFGEKYDKICGADVVVKKAMDCLGGKSNIENVKTYLNNATCTNLNNTKLMVSKRVGYDLLKLNKSQVQQDESKKLQQQQRTKYDRLLELFMINYGYVQKITTKWPSKTKNAY